MNNKRVVLMFPSVLVLILLVSWLQLIKLNAAAPSATLNVNNTADATDATPGNGICETGTGNGQCTLRAAIQEANFANTADVIIIPSGIYTLTLEGEDSNAAVGDLDIRYPVEIIGAGSAQTIIDGNDLDTIFTVINYTSGEVTISNLTIQNGQSRHLRGGGICNCGDHAVILNSVILRNNQARDGAGIANFGQFYIQDSQIMSNTSNMDKGGGMAAAIFNYAYLQSAHLVIRNSTVRNNSSLDRAAIMNYGDSGQATMIIINSAIHHNTTVATTSPTYGGGIHQLGNASLSILNSTISQNSMGSQGMGGGLQIENGTATINNSTIAANNAPNGGGIYEGNSTVTIHNSLVANNSSNNCNTSLSSTGYNLDSGNSCGFNQTGDLTNSNPLLLPLADNGGSTWTHALNAGSPAIDAGQNANCPITDQRFYIRPIDGDGNSSAVCDIGAYEYGSQLLILDNWMYLPLTRR